MFVSTREISQPEIATQNQGAQVQPGRKIVPKIRKEAATQGSLAMFCWWHNFVQGQTCGFLNFLEQKCELEPNDMWVKDCNYRDTTIDLLFTKFS